MLDEDSIRRIIISELISGMDNSSSEDKSLDLDAVMDNLCHQYKYWKTIGRHTLLSELGQAFKSATNSFKVRNLGNAKFKNKQYHEALHLYTQSVASAPEGSEELMLAYGNWSAVSFRIGEWESSIMDINRALKGQYSENLKKKLLSRKEECLIELQKEDKNTKRAKLVEKETNPVRLEDSESDAEWNQLCKFENPLLPNASSKIRLEFNDHWGRFVVASDNIEPGEILSSQKLLAWGVEPEAQYMYNHCSYCLLDCVALISCPLCNEMYCSEYCRAEAYNLYHRVECKLLSFKVIRTMGDSERIALRLFLVGSKQGDELEILMKMLPIRKIFDEETDPTGKPFVNDYLSALKMRRTFPANITESDAWCALEVTMLLQHIGFFGRDCQNSELPDDLGAAELFATMLLMNNISSARLNKFGISLSDWDIVRNDTKTIGAGICPLHNFLNHSCDPNAIFLMRNKEHVLFAIQPIAKGKQIFTAYCPSFATKPIEERRQTMSNYRFTCFCEACVNEWPLQKTMLKEIKQKNPPTCKIEFLVKNKKEAIAKLKKTVRSVLQKKTLSDRAVLSICRKYLKWLFTNIKRPFIAHLECQDLLFHCMHLLYDDFHRGKHLPKFRAAGFPERILNGTVNLIFNSFK